MREADQPIETIVTNEAYINYIGCFEPSESQADHNTQPMPSPIKLVK